MTKTKLGISVAFLAAGIYLTGAVNLLAAIVVGGYVFLNEEDAWLKLTTIKAITITFFFLLLGTGVDLVEQVFRLLQNFFDLVSADADFNKLYKFCGVMDYALLIVKNAFLMIGALKALEHKSLRFSIVDTLLKNHLRLASNENTMEKVGT